MCQCKNVEIGSFDNQVMLDPPKHMREFRNIRELSAFICIDRCLKDEVKYLWSLGITTTGCCCGHNRIDGYIGVIDKDIPKMKKLGYKVQLNKFRPQAEDTFYPKSI